VALAPVIAALWPGRQLEPLDPDGAQAFCTVASLSGKTVRMTYGDGAGVESVQPLGCELLYQEVCLLSDTSPLWELHCLAETSGDWLRIDAESLNRLMMPLMYGTVGSPLQVMHRPYGGRVREGTGSHGTGLDLLVIEPLSHTKGHVQCAAGGGPVTSVTLAWQAQTHVLSWSESLQDVLNPDLELCENPSLTMVYSRTP